MYSEESIHGFDQGFGQCDADDGLPLRITGGIAGARQQDPQDASASDRGRVTRRRRVSLASESSKNQLGNEENLSRAAHENLVTARESLRSQRSSLAGSEALVASENKMSIRTQNKSDARKANAKPKHSPIVKNFGRIFEVNELQFCSSGQSFLRQQAQSLEPVGRLNLRTGAGATDPDGGPSGGSQTQRYKHRQVLREAALRSPRSPPQRDEQNAGSNVKLRIQQLQSAQKSNYKEFQKEIFQQKSMLLEDELYQTQTELRRKEGTYAMQIALLTQQLSQLRTEMGEAQNRENQQKAMYEKVQNAIYEELRGKGSLSESQVQQSSILAEARKAFGPARDAWPDDSAEGSAIDQEKRGRNERVKDIRTKRMEDGQQNGEVQKSPGDIRSEDAYGQLSEKNAIIRKYEAQSKKFIEEITELQAQNDNYKRVINDFKDASQDMMQKIAKLEEDLVEQKERELKLKSLHSDEMKYITDMRGDGLNLYESKIKELEVTVHSLQKKLQSCNTKEDPAASAFASQHTSSQPGGLESCEGGETRPDQAALSRATGPNPSQQRQLSNPNDPKYSTSEVTGVSLVSGAGQDPRTDHNLEDGPPRVLEGNLVVGDRHQTESLGQIKILEAENAQLRIELQKLESKGDQQLEEWQQAKADLENTAIKLKKTMNQNLLNHKDATDRLRTQLKEAVNQVEQRDDENKLLKSKVAMIRSQISKLEKIQQGELSRSRSTSRRGSSFRFGMRVISQPGATRESCGFSPSEKAEKNSFLLSNNRSLNRHQLRRPIKDYQSQGSTESDVRRLLPKQRLFAANQMKLSIKDLVHRGEGAGEAERLQESTQTLRPLDQEGNNLRNFKFHAKSALTMAQKTDKSSLRTERAPGPKNQNQSKSKLRPDQGRQTLDRGELDALRSAAKLSKASRITQDQSHEQIKTSLPRGQETNTNKKSNPTTRRAQTRPNIKNCTEDNENVAKSGKGTGPQCANEELREAWLSREKDAEGSSLDENPLQNGHPTKANLYSPYKQAQEHRDTSKSNGAQRSDVQDKPTVSPTVDASSLQAFTIPRMVDQSVQKRSKSRQSRIHSRNRGQGLNLARYLSNGGKAQLRTQDLEQSPPERSDIGEQTENIPKNQHLEGKLSGLRNSKQNLDEYQRRKMTTALASCSTSRLNTVKNKMISCKAQAIRHQELSTQMALKEVTRLKNIKGSMLGGSETQKTLGTQNPIGMESELGPADHGGPAGNNLLNTLKNLNNESHSHRQGACSASEVATKCLRCPSRGGKPGEALASRSLLYQSIQCHQSPSQYRLEHSSNQKGNQFENQSCKVNQNSKQQRYFGNISPRKKLISNLIDDHPKGDNYLYTQGSLVPNNAKRAAKTLEKNQNNKKNLSSAKKQQSAVHVLKDKSNWDEKKKCPLILNNVPESMNDQPEPDSSMKISPIRQESPALNRRRFCDNNSDMQPEKIQPSQSRVRHIMLDSERGPSHLSLEKTASQESASSQTSLCSDQLTQEMDKVLHSILQHSLPTEEANNIEIDFNINGHHSNVDISEIESPPKMPATSNQTKQHHRYQADDQLGPSCQDLTNFKQQASLKLKVDPRHLISKFEELYQRILRRDKKIHDIKDQNKRIKKTLEAISAKYNQIFTKYQQCDQQRKDLLLRNRKFECRLKQAQIILNDHADDLNLQLVPSNKDLEADHWNSANPLDELVGADPNQIASVCSRGTLDAIPTKDERNGVVKGQRANSIKQSLEDIQLQQNQIRRMESMRSVQRLLSAREGARSGHGSSFTESEMMTSRAKAHGDSKERKGYITRAKMEPHTDGLLEDQLVTLSGPQQLGPPAALLKSPKNSNTPQRPDPPNTASKNQDCPRSTSGQVPRTLGQAQQIVVIPKIDLTPIDKFKNTMAQEDESHSKLGKQGRAKLGRAERNLNELNLERPNEGKLVNKHERSAEEWKRSTNDQRRLSSAQSLSNFNTVNFKSVQNKHSARNEHPKRQDVHHQPSSARPLALGKTFAPKTQIHDIESVQGSSSKEAKRLAGHNHQSKAKNAHYSQVDRPAMSGLNFGGSGVAPRLQVDLDQLDQAHHISKFQSLTAARHNHSGPDIHLQQFKTAQSPAPAVNVANSLQSLGSRPAPTKVRAGSALKDGLNHHQRVGPHQQIVHQASRGKAGLTHGQQAENCPLKNSSYSRATQELQIRNKDKNLRIGTQVFDHHCEEAHHHREVVDPSLDKADNIQRIEKLAEGREDIIDERRYRTLNGKSELVLRGAHSPTQLSVSRNSKNQIVNKSERRYDEQEVELPNSCIEQNHFNDMNRGDAIGDQVQHPTRGINSIVAKAKTSYFGNGTLQQLLSACDDQPESQNTRRHSEESEENLQNAMYAASGSGGDFASPSAYLTNKDGRKRYDDQAKQRARCLQDQQMTIENQSDLLHDQATWAASASGEESQNSEMMQGFHKPQQPRLNQQELLSQNVRNLIDKRLRQKQSTGTQKLCARQNSPLEQMKPINAHDYNDQQPASKDSDLHQHQQLNEILLSQQDNTAYPSHAQGNITPEKLQKIMNTNELKLAEAVSLNALSQNSESLLHHDDTAVEPPDDFGFLNGGEKLNRIRDLVESPSTIPSKGIQRSQLNLPQRARNPPQHAIQPSSIYTKILNHKFAPSAQQSDRDDGPPNQAYREYLSAKAQHSHDGSGASQTGERVDEGVQLSTGDLQCSLRSSQNHLPASAQNLQIMDNIQTMSGSRQSLARAPWNSKGQHKSRDQLHGHPSTSSRGYTQLKNKKSQNLGPDGGVQPLAEIENLEQKMTIIRNHKVTSSKTPTNKQRAARKLINQTRSECFGEPLTVVPQNSQAGPSASNQSRVDNIGIGNTKTKPRTNIRAAVNL